VADRSGRWVRAGLARRTATVVVVAPLMIAAVWVAGWPLAVVVAALAAAGAVELWRIALAAGVNPSPALPAGAVVFPVLAALERWYAVPAALAGLTMLAGAWALLESRRPQALANAAVDVLGGAYVGVLLAHLVLLRNEAGFTATLIVLAAVWVNDIAAYFVGVAWGRRRLAPTISPGKSVEGFAAGVVVAAVISSVAGGALGWPRAAGAALGGGVALAAVAGDLWESAIKRSAGVKDSGGLLPGHGGVLDRMDAVLFGVPVGYYLMRWLIP
jgi:phosphatidate cytidylyltransferase